MSENQTIQKLLKNAKMPERFKKNLKKMCKKLKNSEMSEKFKNV